MNRPTDCIHHLMTAGPADSRRPCARHIARILACLLTGCMLLACKGHGGLLPSSGGRLYEVLLVADREDVVRQMLEADTDGLPQSEPSFDVSAVDSAAFVPALRQARNIVVVSINPTVYTHPHVGYERNVWAKPQMVVRIGAPSVGALRQSAASVSQALRALLLRAEARKTLSLLRQKRNTQAEQTVRRLMGVDLWIPVDMVASKQGTDYIWLSNNNVEEMQNIVVYRQPAFPGNTTTCADDESVEHFVALRNAVLGRAIKGETDSMWMTTVGKTVTRQGYIYRGLWEMHADDMGGPFVSRCLPARTKDGQAVVAEGFVFAPGRHKRNAIRRLQTLLYTLRWHTSTVCSQAD